MSGYMFASAPCIGCGNVFSFNPDLVPSVRINGVREPICQSCVDRVNPQRKAKGLPPIVPAPGAYSPQEVA